MVSPWLKRAGQLTGFGRELAAESLSQREAGVGCRDVEHRSCGTAAPAAKHNPSTTEQARPMLHTPSWTNFHTFEVLKKAKDLMPEHPRQSEPGQVRERTYEGVQ